MLLLFNKVKKIYLKGENYSREKLKTWPDMFGVLWISVRS